MELGHKNEDSDLQQAITQIHNANQRKKATIQSKEKESENGFNRGKQK